MKKLCVFDLDGTLVNTIYDIAGAMNRSLAQMGKPTHPVSAYYKMVGDGMINLCKRALPDGSKEEVDCLIQKYKTDYLENCCVESVPYEGMINLLQSLKESGMMLAIITNKPQVQTDEVVEKLLKRELFSAVIGSGGDFPCKPDTAAMDFVMEQFNLKPEEIWHIGDSDVDMIFGKCASVDAIGVSWGFRGEEELRKNGATAIVHDALELQEYIKKNRNH